MKGYIMRIFDTKIQDLKYRVLREVARFENEGSLLENITDIPKTIVPGKTPTMRCCVYMERAVLSERIKLAMGGNKANTNAIEVIDIACDECPMGGYEVTDACRGCLAHRCEDVCKKGAITFDRYQKARIDKSKCVECGACSNVCPYGAIVNNKRPCQRACKVKAISVNEDNAASINNKKCIACGACIYQCPFGAISEKSYILDVVNILKDSTGNTAYNTYAIVAPSISSQFTYAKLGQVIKGIKLLGFRDVVETALGADMTALKEARELSEKGFLMSSCCPAFVDYVRKEFPSMAKHISENPSPMAELAAYIKKTDPSSKVVFIGPCTAKKEEFKSKSVSPFVDSVITFEELQALFDSRDVDITSLEEEKLDNASYYGRIFARSGGLSEAVAESMKEQNIDFTVKPAACDGIEACRTALLKASKGVLDANFIEGMACTGGCIGGAGCLTHGIKDKHEVDKYGMESYEKKISDSVSILK